jgi:hypothetical protein
MQLMSGPLADFDPELGSVLLAGIVGLVGLSTCVDLG